jgi:hypothetical protein
MTIVSHVGKPLEERSIMPSITYQCSVDPTRTITQRMVGTIQESTRVHDGELYVRVVHSCDEGRALELIVDRKKVFVPIETMLGRVPVLVGTEAQLVEEEEASQ